MNSVIRFLCLLVFTTLVAGLTSKFAFASNEIRKLTEARVSPECEIALVSPHASGIAPELPQHILSAFAQIQQDYKSDPEMLHWRSPNISNSDYDSRIKAGKDIPGMLVSYLSSQEKILTELRLEFPDILTLLPAILPMKWDATAYFDIPQKYLKTRPFEVTDAPAIYEDFSHVNVRRKTFVARGLVPTQLSWSPLMRFMIKFEKSLATNESTMSTSIQLRATNDSEHLAAVEFLRQFLPEGKLVEIKKATYSFAILETETEPLKRGLNQLEAIFGRLGAFLKNAKTHQLGRSGQ